MFPVFHTRIFSKPRSYKGDLNQKMLQNIFKILETYGKYTRILYSFFSGHPVN